MNFKGYEQSLFTYLIYEDNVILANELMKVIHWNRYIINLSEKTEFQKCNKGNKSIGIIGFCVDAKSEISSDAIAEYILDASESIEDVIKIEERLAGKYILMYIDIVGNLYVIGDATCSIPINYYFENKFVLSSSSDLIAKHLGLTYSVENLEIRNSSDVSQALPYNITLYDEIKQLLPTEYLDVKNKKCLKLLFKGYGVNKLSIIEAAEQTAPLIDNIVKSYIKNFEVICPLTSGKDSRVVLAFLEKNLPKVECYTLYHENFRSDEPDLVIPKKITNALGLNYQQIYDQNLPKDIIYWFDSEFGEGLYSKYTLNLAYTIITAYPNRAIINGDIIGQIGKSSLHRDLPVSWANTFYFICKLHNYHESSIKILENWVNSSKVNDNRISIYDLFSWDIRLGRWAAQENLIYNTLGIPYLNIFNCRKIILSWVQTNRKFRKNSHLHTEILKLINPKLLKFAYGKDKNIFYKLAKSNKLFFYMASYLKYWIIKMQK